ncbi:MAG: hypothetical protein ACRD0W_00300 [Acidimicrobiales bacterium]
MAERRGEPAVEKPVEKPPAVEKPVEKPAAGGEVVRRRRPGFKLVNGGWVRDPTAGKGDR